MTERPILKGSLKVPGDKSISHRALIFSLLAEGDCSIEHLSPAQDCQSTIDCLRALGVQVKCPGEPGSQHYVVSSPSLRNLQPPANVLDAGNSGTTIRLLSGLLAGSPISCRLDGDSSLRRRPMARVLNPLTQMGARVEYHATEGCPPFTLQGGKLQGQPFSLPIASAQVQTAILLAGLQAEGETSVSVPNLVRDHTERMFRYIGIPFEQPSLHLTIVRRMERAAMPFEITVPGDISSAAFFMVAAACAPGSEIHLVDVGINPGRLLVVDILQEMGARIEVQDKKEINGEPVANIVVKGGARLSGTSISGDRIAAGIDEIPVLALAGAFCHGTFSVRNAEELRVKESDRLTAICQNLAAAGASIEQLEDGFDVHGSGMLTGGSHWQTLGDHRLAMTGLVANLLCDRPLEIDDTACAAVSYPDFERDLHSLIEKAQAPA